MQKIKEAVLDLLHNDKKRLVLFIVNVSIYFIAFLGLLIPFMVGTILNNNHVSMAQAPGGTILTILFVVLMFLYAFFFIMKKDEIAKKVFLGSTVLLTLIYFYGVLLHRVGVPTTATGFGAWMILLMLIAMYFMIFGSNYALKYIDKLVKTPVQPEPVAPVVEEPVAVLEPVDVPKLVVEETVVEEPVKETKVVEPVVEELDVKVTIEEPEVVEAPQTTEPEPSQEPETVEEPKPDKEKE